jgi:hypothetical protein
VTFGTHVFEHGVNGSDVVVGEAFSLVFAPKDIAEFLEVFEGGCVVISPDGVGLELGLEAPTAAKTFGSYFAFFAVGSDSFPNRNVPHGKIVFGGA